jgi:tRNA threonylcarbamoyladenosine biosynthesis protein TsaE
LRPDEHLVVTSCPAETLRFGEFLGRHLSKGFVIALNGELGSGKTCLTQGIARGLEVPKSFYVTSPTFSLVNEYPGLIRLFHVDLYRVADASELDEIGLDDILAADGVTVIEWAQKMLDSLPTQRLDVSIAIVDDQTRHFHLTAYGQRANHLLKHCIAYSN